MRTYLLQSYFLAIFSGSVFGQVNLQNGLSACFQFDCTNDPVVVNSASSGTVLNGTKFGSITCEAGHTGAPATGVGFSGGAGDYIKLAANPMIKPTSSLTIAGWFYLTSNGMQDIIFTKNTCATNFNMNNLIWNNGQFWIAKRPGTAGNCGVGAILQTTANPSYSLNTWYFVVAYIDNFTLELSIDNGPATILAHNVAFDYDPNGDVILGGTNQSAANFPYSGRMDNLRFYTRKLSTSEIGFLYMSDPDCKYVDVGLNNLSSHKIDLIQYDALSSNLELQGNIKSIRVMNLCGQDIWQQENSDHSEQKIDLGFLENGVYLLEVKTVDGERQVERVMVGR